MTSTMLTQTYKNNTIHTVHDHPVFGSYHGYGSGYGSSNYNSHDVGDVACHGDEGQEHGGGAVVNL
jgi:hypothetical protein